jgi:hypothetical protein
VSLTKLNGFVGVGIGAAFGVGAAFLAFIELGADELAEFAFDDAIMFMGVVDDLLQICDVFRRFVTASIMTLVNPSSMHSLQSSKESPWSRWTAMGMVVRLTAASISFLR